MHMVQTDHESTVPMLNSMGDDRPGFDYTGVSSTAGSVLGSAIRQPHYSPHYPLNHLKDNPGREIFQNNLSPVIQDV